MASLFPQTDKSTHNTTTIVSLAMTQIKAFPFNPSATCWLLQQLIIPATVEPFLTEILTVSLCPKEVHA